MLLLLTRILLTRRRDRLRDRGSVGLHAGGHRRLGLGLSLVRGLRLGDGARRRCLTATAAAVVLLRRRRGA
jgi:hypothetical protein